MGTQNAKSVKLVDNAVGQISPRSKAADVIFADGISLQKKYENLTLVNPGTLDSIHAISPVIAVIANTENEFRLRIKSIAGTIVTPNLKGADEETLVGRIRNTLAELEARVNAMPDQSRINELISKVDMAAENIARLQEEFDGFTVTKDYRSVDLFPATGETGELYLDEENDRLYRWDEDEQKYKLLCGNTTYDASTDADIDALFN